MKKWAVAYINFYDNELEIRQVEADTWFKALFKAFPEECSEDSFEGFSENSLLTDMKQEAFNQDSMFDVKEIL